MIGSSPGHCLLYCAGNRFVYRFFPNILIHLAFDLAAQMRKIKTADVNVIVKTNLLWYTAKDYHGRFHYLVRERTHLRHLRNQPQKRIKLRRANMKERWLFILVLVLVVVFSGIQAFAGILADVKAKGSLTLGVSEGVPGFSIPDSSG